MKQTLLALSLACSVPALLAPHPHRRVVQRVARVEGPRFLPQRWQLFFPHLRLDWEVSAVAPMTALLAPLLLRVVCYHFFLIFSHGG